MTYTFFFRNIKEELFNRKALRTVCIGGVFLSRLHFCYFPEEKIFFSKICCRIQGTVVSSSSNRFNCPGALHFPFSLDVIKITLRQIVDLFFKVVALLTQRSLACISCLKRRLQRFDRKRQVLRYPNTTALASILDVRVASVLL